MTRYALSLWFLCIAALGLMRFWMKLSEAAGTPLRTDEWLWLAGAAACTVAALIAFLAAHSRRREDD